MPGVLTKVIDKFLLHFALDINVNMKMYSIAVAVNHSGTQIVALAWNIFVLFFYNHTREFMHRDNGAEILARCSCTESELQYNVWSFLKGLKLVREKGLTESYCCHEGGSVRLGIARLQRRGRESRVVRERYRVGTREGAV